ncbi:MAG: hypothetical protein CMI32_04200, partial [Opitutales bacterium]|nr:hypothetical protein [Opitutales bacterium]
QALEQNQKEAVEKKGFVEQVAKITAETKAKAAAQQAQVELEKTKQQTQAAPKIVEEKQTATNATQAKVAETNKTRDAFKATVEVQRAKAEALLKKYLDALPK